MSVTAESLIVEFGAASAEKAASLLDAMHVTQLSGHRHQC